LTGCFLLVFAAIAVASAEDVDDVDAVVEVPLLSWTIFGRGV